MAKEDPPKAKTRNDPLRVALFEFGSILEFLRYVVEVQRSVRGVRTRLSEAAGCQPSYLSQVLAGSASLSQEQLFGIARFLELDDVSWEYVRELGLFDRAGTEELRDDCKRRLVRIRGVARADRPPEVDVSQPAKLSSDDLLWYVSSWQVSAILAAVVMPSARSPAALAKLLGLPTVRAQEVVKQLLERSMLKRNEAGELVSNLPSTLYIGTEAAGQTFRTGWILHGIARAQSGYRDGFQKGGVFRADRKEFAALKAEVTALHRAYFSQDRDPASCDTIGYFGIELFEA